MGLVFSAARSFYPMHSNFSYAPNKKIVGCLDNGYEGPWRVHSMKILSRTIFFQIITGISRE